MLLLRILMPWSAVRLLHRSLQPLNKSIQMRPTRMVFGDDDEVDADDLEGGDPQLIQRVVKAIQTDVGHVPL